MRIFLADTAGFCMGVKRAVNIGLELAARQKGGIYTIGPLIHNPQTVEMLELKGIKVIKDISEVKSGTIIIRAHGMTPESKKRIEGSGLGFSDATCPLVVRIQKTIKRYADAGYVIVIVGDKGHAEVEGLLGYASGRGTVIEKEDDLVEVPSGKLCVVAQSTQNRTFFEIIVNELIKHRDDIKVFDTICDATTERQEEVRMLAAKVDAMVIVGGRNSANTRRLAEISSSLGVKTFQVENENELEEKEIAGCENIGVTAGASTPNWVIEKVMDRLNIISNKRQNLPYEWLLRTGAAIVKSDMLVGIGAGLLCFSTIVLQDVKPVLMISAFLSSFISSCYVFGIHILNHYTDREYAQYKESYKLTFLDKHKNLLVILGVVSLFCAILMSLRLGVIPFVILLFASVSGLIYSFKIVPAPIAKIVKITRLRDIPASKNLLTALAWCVIIAFVPVFEMQRTLDAEKWRQLAIVMAFTFTLVFTRSTLLDVRDIQGDLMLGNETIPILLGKKRTRILLLAILLTCSVVLVFAVWRGWVTSLGYFLIAPIAYCIAYMFDYRRRHIYHGVRTEIAANVSFFISGAIAIAYYLANS
jgi:(E)-4-hydroxy-3-methyl-but-2-enyl pyrophosphate reductase